MELFRSQPMQYVSLTVPVDAASDVMREVGKMAKFHIVDLNEHVSVPTDFYLFHKKRVVAASYWERKLKRFEDVMAEFEIPLPPIDAPRDASMDAKGDVLADVKNYVEPLELELNRNVEYRSAETRKMNELYERAIVLEVSKAHLFSGEMAAIPQGDVARFRNARAEVSKSGTSELLEEDKKAQQAEEGGGRFHNYVCGVMPVLQQSQFDRMLFRISRGNAYARYAAVEEDIRDPATNEPMKKTVFYVAFVGSQVGRRVEKMCDYFRATRYDVPNTPEAFDAELLQIGVQIQEKRAVVDRTTEQIVSLLQKVAWDSVEKHFSPLRNWEELLHRERLISDALKKTVVPNGSRILRCEGWCPVDEISNLNNALHEAVALTGGQPPIVQYPLVKQRPPTYFKLNKFTASFQGIVDTYGVPRYQEVNPGLFTIVTFPFLFGIMYGDIGHGCLLFCFALMMVLKEQEFLQKIKNKTMPELLGMAFGGRYLLLGMGICAIYCGIIYNDFMSIPLNVYGTAWHWNGTAITANAPTKVYPIGIDPGWYHTKNELTFFNSLKMKISVTFGVVQMCFGIVLGLFNHVYFKNYVSIYCEFVPQLLFMLCTFGYMILMILIKFCIDWENSPGRSAPNLIQTMIAMFLSPGSVKAEEQLFAGQAGFQAFLVIVALICVPWMLFPKPYIERHHHNQRKLVSNRKPVGPAFEAEDTLELDEKKTAAATAHGHSHGAGAHGHAHGEAGASEGHGHGHDDEEEFNFSEHMIHQAIHTIEFILGAVSNTASYLRLWALSLAHEQLAKVFWTKMIMDYGIGSGSWFMGVVGFGAWAFATVGVLLAMDVLECFLHALRLHWVEFQSKFFQADGYAFTPFDFAVQDDAN